MMDKQTEFTTAEAARLLGVTQRNIQSAIKRGVMRARTVGPILLIPAVEIARYRLESLGQRGRPKGRAGIV